ncbi:hypothetical protein MMPV_007013 [Pyropia vietnamensis]
MANAVRTSLTVAVATLLVVVLVSVSSTDAIDIGRTCPCAKVGGGSGLCVRWVSGTATEGSCTIGKCDSTFMCVPDAKATHVCQAQAGSGKSLICKGVVKSGQMSCPCWVKPNAGVAPSLVPVQTVPHTATPSPTAAPSKCKSNDQCDKNEVCVSGMCEAAGDCSSRKRQVCDEAYTRATGLTDNRAKCCPESSNCVKNGVQAGQSTACSTNCGKKCEPFCSLSAIDGVPLCSDVEAKTEKMQRKSKK